MKQALAKIWILIAFVVVLYCAWQVIIRDPDRLRGLATAGVAIIIGVFLVMTIEACRTLGPSATDSSVPVESPKRSFFDFDCNPILFLTIGPVTENRGPVYTASKRHRPMRISTMGLTLLATQQAVVTLSFKDKRNNPAAAPGSSTSWTTSDPTIVTVAPAPDGLSALVASAGAIGTAQVKVTSGSVTGELDVTVEAGVATSVTLTPSAPTEEPNPV